METRDLMTVFLFLFVLTGNIGQCMETIDIKQTLDRIEGQCLIYVEKP